MRRHIFSIPVAAVALAIAVTACKPANATNSDAEADEETEVTVEADADATTVPEESATVISTDGYTTTDSGLMYKVVKEGSGKQPGAEDVVTVHYTGRHLDGTVFDSSVERGEPATFPLNGVIAGWTEGLQLMKEGAKYEFIIPANLAYGDRGTPGGPIAPGEDLYFEVELIKVN